MNKYNVWEFFLFSIGIYFVVFVRIIKPRKLRAQGKARVTKEVICKYQNHEFKCQRTSPLSYMNPQYIPKLSVLYCWSHCSTDKYKVPSAGVSSEIKCMCFTVCQLQGYIIYFYCLVREDKKYGWYM